MLYLKAAIILVNIILGSIFWSNSINLAADRAKV